MRFAAAPLDASDVIIAPCGQVRGIRDICATVAR
jgi:hypothetical protein